MKNKKINSKSILTGIIPAVITPLEQDGKICIELLQKQVDYLASSGVQGFFVNGTSGEGAWLSIEEKIVIYKIVRGLKKQGQFLCAACIQPSTEMVLREVDTFASLEPDFIVAVTPYYYKVSQNDILYHFQKIADYSPFPVILYNIPQHTNNNIEISTILELAKINNIAGIKDSSGNFINFSRICLSDLPKHFSLIQGEDYLDAASFNIGADGIVTGLGNVYIKPYVDMYLAAQSGDFKRVIDKQRQINALYEIIQITERKVIPAIKAATSLLGRSHQWMKISSQTLDVHEIEKIKMVLHNLNLI
ncbi:MAG: 4-hydroxy-tetrahydrodipicolinate synthase [Candidatus Caldatribacteriota bacterium]